ncbi:Myosin-binding domain protein [Kalmanozyma brasiliensis GHG001]|uniref:Myosin-binding domain protein n=1 Tax=Kalmanozyma brasiliensis (strain GHG001) TaxID=1365824 RepID=UPI002867DF8A|nr:Myosin-binding domain protein [Kalmanozyma brasiliensis GHG001]KAF6767231.1 Myosin-binding domain protein [Kalmanozyma brasiliensis GHG001]
MAEAVIFGGSPLDQYLRDADQTEEQALVNDAASVVETQEPVYTERQPIDVSNASFIEKFKYAICSSFLLTPSLSISFYESGPPFQNPDTKQKGAVRDKQPSNGTRRSRSERQASRKQCFVKPSEASPAIIEALDAWTQKRLPRLDAQGRLARNAALVSALFLLPPISRSWRLWLATFVIVASFVWAFVLLFDHSSLDDTLEFVVSRQAGHSAAASTKSLRKLSTTLEYSSAEKKALQRAVLPDVSRLIKAAQSFDVSINKAISAIQEVEIVSRGYKLTHPLPPISRIEAASSSSRVDSPTRSRRSLIPSAPSANAKLGRSLSGGGHGAPTVRRHAYRPLSLNLSNGRFSPLDRPSGRVSPAVSSEVGDLDLTQKMLVEQSTAALATGRQAPQRLVELRKGIVDALEQVGARCTSSTLSLETLTDAEELAMLHDLYALDAAPQDGTDVDAQQAWFDRETLALSEGSPDPEHDRRAWSATTPRNFGRDGRSATSPQTVPVNSKRLSLVSDASSIQDRHPRTSSSLSRRSSLTSETGNVGSFRSPRLHYVSDRSTSASGPNESAAAKRLSYASNSTSSAATGLFEVRSPVMRNTSNFSSLFTPPHSSTRTYSGATSPQSKAIKRGSILGSNSIFAHMEPSASSNPASSQPLSLLTIKAKFEWMHRARRRWLCHLLALHLRMSEQVRLSSGDTLPCDDYWIAARSTIESMAATLLDNTRQITAMIARDMGPASLQTSIDERRVTQQSELLTVSNSEADAGSLAGHPGIEDRLHAMMLSLRSLQSKIRVCAEDIRIKPIPGLHGVEPSQAVATFEKESDDAAIASQLGATLESMRDDFVGLSAEWEATIKLVYKEKRRSPSPQPSIDLEADASASSAARDLVSPLEADEDDIHPLRTNGSSDSGLPASDGQAQDATLGNASDNEDDEDLAALLLSSTSPNSLPPPGLEQVFESIAGMAGLSALSADGRKLSRTERIDQARRQRQEQQDRQASEVAPHRHSMDPSGMMSELNDVISSRKAVREQRHQSAMPFSAPPAVSSAAQSASAPSSGAPPALVLGSPLDLGSAEHDGVFDASHSFNDAKAMPRRSLSSLDLARARAMQALEARSSSASSSASNSLDSGDESMLSVSDDFSFEPTALESVPEDDAAATASILPSPHWESTSSKATPKASQAPLFSSTATAVPESPFDLGAQVAAYARRKKAAKAQAAAMQASGSESSVASQASQ